MTWKRTLPTLIDQGDIVKAEVAQVYTEECNGTSAIYGSAVRVEVVGGSWLITLDVLGTCTSVVLDLDEWNLSTWSKEQPWHAL